MIVADKNKHVLTVSEKGLGKRSKVSLFRLTARGGQGIIAMQATAKTGNIINAIQVSEDQDILLITDKGTMVRMPAREISILGRNTQGVRMIKLSAKETLTQAQCFLVVPDKKEIASSD